VLAPEVGLEEFSFLLLIQPDKRIFPCEVFDALFDHFERLGVVCVDAEPHEVQPTVEESLFVFRRKLADERLCVLVDK